MTRVLLQERVSWQWLDHTSQNVENNPTGSSLRHHFFQEEIITRCTRTNNSIIRTSTCTHVHVCSLYIHCMYILAICFSMDVFLSFFNMFIVVVLLIWRSSFQMFVMYFFNIGEWEQILVLQTDRCYDNESVTETQQSTRMEVPNLAFRKCKPNLHINYKANDNLCIVRVHAISAKSGDYVTTFLYLCCPA